MEKGESSVSVQVNRSQNYVLKADSMNNDAKSASLVERTEEKLPSSEARPKEGVHSHHFYCSEQI